MHFFELFVQKLSAFSFFNIGSLFGFKMFEMPFVIMFMIAMIIISLAFVGDFVFKNFISGFRSLFEKPKDSKDDSFSSFKCLASSLSSTMGLGATAGMTYMVYIFGPGIVFYIPIAALLCVPLRFVEIMLSNRYRQKGKDGLYEGGPTLYTKEIFKNHNMAKIGIFLSVIYGLIVFFSSFFGPAMLEINQVAEIISSFKFAHGQREIISIISVIFVGIIIVGGIKRISNFFGYLMPIFVTSFVLMCIVTTVYYYENIIPTVKLIIESAINPKNAGIGGIITFLFYTLRRMGLSTEVGLGSASTMHINSKKPAIEEAISGMLSPFIGSILISFFSGFIIVLTGHYNMPGMGGTGIVLLSESLGSCFSFFKIVVSVLTVIMALNVMIGWSYYGSESAKRMFGKKAKYPYIFLYLLAGFAGGVIKDFGLIISLTDAILMLAFILNFFSVILDIKKIRKETKEYVTKS